MNNYTVASLYELISRCCNQIPGSILLSQKELSYSLAHYYGYNKRWTLDDLEEALRDKYMFSRYCPSCSDVQIKLVYDDELHSMGLSPDMLDLKRRSIAKDGWFLPFLNSKLFDEFEKTMKLLYRCGRAIE